MQIGDKTIDYNEEFRLFLTTRNPSPEIPPDAASVITEVNFTTTRAGLTGQVGAFKCYTFKYFFYEILSFFEYHPLSVAFSREVVVLFMNIFDIMRKKPIYQIIVFSCWEP